MDKTIIMGAKTAYRDLYALSTMGGYLRGLAFTFSAIDPTHSPPCSYRGGQEIGNSTLN